MSQKILTGPTLTFTRKKKRGVNQKVFCLWLTPEGYRLIWRREFWGVSVPPRFQACVRTHQPGNFEGGYTKIWDFVNHKKPLFKTVKAAIAECERHKRIWSKACQCPGVRALRALFDGRLPNNLPIWVRNKLDRGLLRIITDITPHRGAEEEEETDQPLPEPEPELANEPTKRRRRRKGTQPGKEPKKRRERSDKGQKRGPRQPAAEPIEPAEPAESTEGRKRRTRNDKGKKRGPRHSTDPTVSAPSPLQDGTKKRRERSDKGKKRGPRKKEPENECH